MIISHCNPIKTEADQPLTLCFVTSSPLSVLVFLAPHLNAMRQHFVLRVLANTEGTETLQVDGLSIQVESIGIVRSIDFIKDFRAIWELYEVLKINCPDAVHTLTPKAGLIGMLVSWLLRVPLRVHTFTGQVWATRSGLMRWLLKSADICTAALATDIFVDSPSQRAFLIAEGVIKKSKSSVLAYGSICGVNTGRFFPDPKVRHKVRAVFGAHQDSLVCLYLGRLTQDKGVLDLAVAFSRIADKNPQAELWVVGPDEEGVFDQMMDILRGLEGRIRRVGYTNAPAQYMQAADLFCLPSYREGFGSSVIEAAACGLPALASRIYGLTDAIVEGETGWMHMAGDVDDLAYQLDCILSKPEDIKQMGRRAQAYASEFFSEELVTNAMLSFYKSRLRVMS